MKKKNIILIIFLILITAILVGVGAGFVIKREKFLNEINYNELDVSQYITYTDDVSKSKAQVNWKYVASILAVLTENKPNLASEEDIKYVANLFLEETKQGFKVRNLEDTLALLQSKNSIELTEKQLERVNNYILDLEHHGIMPERLNPNEKYMKFINSIKDDAIRNYEEYKILPSITIAQAILESSWGESRLSSEFNNLFGIKAHQGWDGESVSVETKEHYDTTIVDEFRAYKTKGESLEDHAKFLKDNPRYKKVFGKKTYSEQAKALEKAGYSTAADENGKLIYHDLLTQIIVQYNLQLIDSAVHEK